MNQAGVGSTLALVSRIECGEQGMDVRDFQAIKSWGLSDSLVARLSTIATPSPSSVLASRPSSSAWHIMDALYILPE